MNACYGKPRFPLLVNLLFNRVLNVALVGLCLPAQLTHAQGGNPAAAAVPSQARQEAMLDAMRNYAGEYITHLPNFICTQDTQQFQAGRKPAHWRKGDTLRFKLVFNDGSEERSLELVNNQRPGPGRRWRAPLTTEGEFGTLLGSVFGPSSSTSFTWRGWDTVQAHRVAVFNFAVDREHSTMKLSLSDLAQSIVPYHGSVYADPDTGQVWRIRNSISDIPKELQTKSFSRIVEYGEVPIGGAKYLLPIGASVLLDTGTSNVRNEMWFSEYRKFEADSRVTFTSDGQGAEPVKPTQPPLER